MENQNKRTLLSGLLLSLMIGCSASDGLQGCVIPSASQRSLIEVQRSFLARHPEYIFIDVKKTAIPGLFEVDTEEDTVYYYPETGHLLIGTLYTPDGSFSEARGSLSGKAPS